MSGRGHGGLNEPLVPARTSVRFRRYFARYALRLLKRRFHATRILLGDGEKLASLNGLDEPVIALQSHASWWDPLIALVIWNRYLGSRDLLMPMDVEQLARFGFFRRLGVFGIDPDDPASLEAMRGYVLDRFEDVRARPTLGLTPQGRFTDPREAIRLRPGAAAIAAASPRPPRVVTVAIEYPFWQDQRPEVLIAVSTCEAPDSGTSSRPSTADWHRSMTAAMTDAAQRLRAAAIDRSPAAFEPVDRRLGGEARINPMMDAWLRLRGRSGGIEARRDEGKITT